MPEKTCPNCGAVTEDGDFCYQCGSKLNANQDGFFSNMNEKINFSTLIFAFVILGIFLFVGSFFWGIFTANGTIGFTTNLLLTAIFAVFFGGIFVGYVNCEENSYIVPNFLAYFGIIAAAVVCGLGFLFAIASAFTTALGSIFSSTPIASGYGGNSYSAAPVNGSGSTSIVSSVLSNLVLEIIIIILLIPAASYLGIYLGYFIKNNLN